MVRVYFLFTVVVQSVAVMAVCIIRVKVRI